MGKTNRRDYTLGELRQLARRRMMQRDHGDKNLYTRKQKHKKDGNREREDN